MYCVLMMIVDDGGGICNLYVDLVRVVVNVEVMMFCFLGVMFICGVIY